MWGPNRLQYGSGARGNGMGSQGCQHLDLWPWLLCRALLRIYCSQRVLGGRSVAISWPDRGARPAWNPCIPRSRCHHKFRLFFFDKKNKIFL